MIVKTERLNVISTHTLTWSVTAVIFLSCLMSVISTHTLTWSVTNCVIISHVNSLFQLTRSRGA